MSTQTSEIALNGPHKDFESIKHLDENGVEYWSARELMPLLEYTKWENFEEVIAKAEAACEASGQVVKDHFPDARKIVKTGLNVTKNVKDWKLDRYACYLIAQNGDSRKKAIALAQTYFAVQTRKQEIFEQLTDDEKRLYNRDQVTTHNKSLFKTAKQAGVSHFGSFNDAGYKGLYGMPLSAIEKRKGVEKGELLDRAGSSELAANLFRITQTDEKIKKENIQGQKTAESVHNIIGGKVRQTIKDIGGTMLEDLLLERHIKELKKEADKKLGKASKKTIKAT